MSDKKTQLFIAKLPREAREDDLVRLFKKFGSLMDVNMKRGYAFVEFNNPNDAYYALENVKDATILGRKIVVELAGDKNRATKGPKEEDACYNCNRKGHWVSECRKPNKRSRNFGDREPRGERDGNRYKRERS